MTPAHRRATATKYAAVAPFIATKPRRMHRACAAGLISSTGRRPIWTVGTRCGWKTLCLTCPSRLQSSTPSSVCSAKNSSACSLSNFGLRAVLPRSQA